MTMRRKLNVWKQLVLGYLIFQGISSFLDFIGRQHNKFNNLNKNAENDEWKYAHQAKSRITAPPSPSKFDSRRLQNNGIYADTLHSNKVPFKYKQLSSKRRILEQETTYAQEVVHSPASSLNNLNMKPSFEQLVTLFTYENVSFETYELNSYLGQVLPIVRPLLDTRPDTCLDVSRGVSDCKSQVSIIIPFYNELWGMLLRNIHSILERTPMDCLKEIILIDDSSTIANLLKPLEQYVQWLPKTRLLRTKQREGLIRARMAGAREAHGDILVFLDAHIEVNIGWLEPLISIIMEEKNTIAIPSVDQIRPYDLSYLPGHPVYRFSGSFTWDLEYIWVAQNPPTENAHLPYPTATMIGCAFAVDRLYFFRIGGFDEGMKIWGGENLEISFRTWQCGGTLKIAPCSRIGHVFRYHLPYKYATDIMMKNLQRLAEVWMDAYRKYFYFSISHDSVPFTKSERNSLDDRKLLRKKLECKSFHWYLQEIDPSVPVPDSSCHLMGQIKSVDNSQCLTAMENNVITFNQCFYSPHVEHFSYTTKGTIESVKTKLCFTVVNSDTGLVMLQVCDDRTEHQRWLFTIITPNNTKGEEDKKPTGYLVLDDGVHTKCLTIGDYYSIPTTVIKTCDFTDSSQFFTFTHMFKKSKQWRYVS